MRTMTETSKQNPTNSKTIDVFVPCYENNINTLRNCFVPMPGTTRKVYISEAAGKAQVPNSQYVKSFARVRLSIDNIDYNLLLTTGCAPIIKFDNRIVIDPSIPLKDRFLSFAASFSSLNEKLTVPTPRKA